MKNIILILIATLVSIHFVKSQDIEKGLITYFPFNENANDESQNNHNGVVNGASLTSDINDNPKSAYYFDGKDDYIQIKNHSDFNSNEMTISLWFKKDKSTTGPSYMDRRVKGLIFMGRDTDGRNRRFDISLWQPKSPYYIQASTCNGIERSVGSIGDITDEKWYHVVFSFDNDSLQVYKNGERTGASKVKNGVAKIADDIVFGKVSMNSERNRYFDGKIDEVRIYNRVVSEEEVKMLFDLNRPVQGQKEIENTVKVKSKTVTVKIWDDAHEDGDIVSVFLNDTRIKKEITVKKEEYVFTLDLKEEVNTFKLLAHNEGESSPNTAAIMIDDGFEEHKRVLSSKKDEFAELQIVFE